MKQAEHLRTVGAFLRARRERLRPEDFGLPAGTRRRTPGLRREEVALLCGISPTWLTWIEQGRTPSLSVSTLAALARGLRLSSAERSYLFQLAARPDPSPVRHTTADPQLMNQLVGAVRSPAYVLDRHWDAIAWNRPAAALFADWLGARGSSDTAGRNLLRYVFLSPSARRFIVDWEDRAQRLVAEYRADTAAWENDPVREALVLELSASSPAFSGGWQSQRVLGRDGGIRRFDHAAHGRCAYEQFTLRVALQSELKLTVLVGVK